MCLYPKTIENRKYKANKKNGGIIPPINDNKHYWIQIKCEQCIECRKQKSRAWQVRLLEDIKTNTNGKMIALTFNNNAIKEIYKAIKLEKYRQLHNQNKLSWRQSIPKGYDLDNAIATYAINHFLERWRKKYKKSIRHWLVTELGHKGTENIHLHGIMWTDMPTSEITRIWNNSKYGANGFTWTGYKKLGKIINYVNEQTVNYTVKYIHKLDKKHSTYKPIILTSDGIGSNYINTSASRKNKYNGKETIETYRTRTGHTINLPKYYKDKIYTEEEKEKLWTQKLDKNEIWIRGERVKPENYDESLKYHRTVNAELGYGKNKDKKYIQRKYMEEKRRTILQEARITASPGSLQKG